MTSEIVALAATDTIFYSQLDESAFFGWLSQLACVVESKGSGRTLYISVKQTAVDESSLRDLLALFWRYKVDMQQLSAFNRKEFPWFRKKGTYWHDAVFKQS